MSHARTAEPAEVLFGAWTHVGPRNHVRWGPRSSQEKGELWGIVWLIIKYRKYLA